MGNSKNTKLNDAQKARVQGIVTEINAASMKLNVYLESIMDDRELSGYGFNLEKLEFEKREEPAVEQDAETVK